jgi:hypothetical protein
MTFVWFGGHLSHYRKLDRKLSDDDMVALAQIRTFGRALPCPTRSMCRADLIDQIKVLTTEREVSPIWLKYVEISATRLSRLWNVHQMPLHTHFSVSTSGCVEVSSVNGGQAGYYRSTYVPWASVDIESTYVVFLDEMGKFNPRRVIPVLNLVECFKKKPRLLTKLTDAFGNYVFPTYEGFSFELVSDASDGRFGPLYEYLYRGYAFTKRRNFAEELFKGRTLPNEIGYMLLLLATAESYLQGHFEDLDGNIVPPTCVLKTSFQGKPFPDIPLWNAGTILRYKVVIPPLVKLTCLAEPGAKTRPLGNNQCWFLAITRNMRFMFEPVMARDGRLRIGLRSTNKMWSFLKYLQKRKNSSTGEWCQSSDFKSSTDYIPLSLIKAMWKGFTHDVHPSHPFMVYFDLIVSNRRLSLLDFREVNELLTDDMSSEERISFHHRCGSFMGEAMSFMTLNGVNVIVDDISDFLFLNGCNPTSLNASEHCRGGWHPLQSKMIDLLEMFQTGEINTPEPAAGCGDDWAAFKRYLNNILLWKDVAIQLGMVFSWKDGISRRVLIFCEDHAIVREDGKIVYIDVIKSRLLTTMTRQHSDNRSSILGKGRMLRNQLDYFENNALKSSIMTVYDEIFSRVYKMTLEEAGIPVWLPPACGGLGYPLLESEIPSHGWKYIQHIFSILEVPDKLERAHLLYELKVLNLPQKKGIQNWDQSLEIFSKLLKDFEFHQYDGNLENQVISEKLIYDDNFVKDVLHLMGRDVPKDPYDPSKYDFDSLKSEAALIGFIKIDEFLGEIERSCNFQEFLSKETVRQQRTLARYFRDSSKYWRRVGIPPNLRGKGITKADCPSFKSFVDLEKKCLFHLNGWIMVSNTTIGMFNSFPTLKVDFRQGRNSKRKPLKDRDISQYIEEINVSLISENLIF